MTKRGSPSVPVCRLRGKVARGYPDIDWPLELSDILSDIKRYLETIPELVEGETRQVR